MQVTIDNDTIQLITDEFYQYMDGVCLFFGLVSEDKETFVPFFYIGGYYSSEWQFDTESAMPTYFKEEPESLERDERDIAAIIEHFNHRRAAGPTCVSNVKLFNHVAKAALIRKNRRVSWAGTEEHGTVMRIDNQEIDVLWDELKGSKTGCLTYPASKHEIQPVG